MNIYIIKHKTGQIMSVNRTILGCSMELYGLDKNQSEASRLPAKACKQRLQLRPMLNAWIIMVRHISLNGTLSQIDQ